MVDSFLGEFQPLSTLLKISDGMEIKHSLIWVKGLSD
jgi:hypothetical protein